MKHDVRRRVASEIREKGTNAVAKRLGVSPVALLSFAGGFPCHAGTAAVIEQRVRAEHTQSDDGPKAA